MLPAPANAQVYELTRWGKAAEDAIFALSRWAAGSPAHDVTLPLSNAAFMLSLRTMMDREKARALSIDLGFRVGGDPLRAQIVDGRIEIERAAPEGADLAFRSAERRGGEGCVRTFWSRWVPSYSKQNKKTIEQPE